MDRGLWHYTRHPNYFGDFCMWWGLFAISYGSWQELPALVAPLLMTFILTRGTGASMTDRRMKASRPGYADYVERTSGFIPLPPNGRRNGVPQPQPRGEGAEVGLLRQPREVPAARVVRQQRHRDAERLLAPPVGLDPGQQVGPARPVELAADPAVGVLQRVGVAARRSRAGQGGEEQVRGTPEMRPERGVVPAPATTFPAAR